jgi:hypothetical protein
VVREYVLPSDIQALRVLMKTANKCDADTKLSPALVSESLTVKVGPRTRARSQNERRCSGSSDT